MSAGNEVEVGPGPPAAAPAAAAPVAVAVNVALLTIRAGQLSVLLVERSGHPYKGAWALPGGFVQPSEDIDDAARRELADETGLTAFPGYLEQLRTYGSPGRDPRMRVVSVGYVGLMPDLPTPRAGTDATAARFWAVADLDGGEAPALAFDHDRIVADAVERTRAKLEYSPLATSFVEEPFTIADLRRVYEAVWGVPLDPANFRRKVLSIEGFVRPTGSQAQSGGAARGRPADLYVAGDAALLHPAMLRPGHPSSRAASREAPLRAPVPLPGGVPQGRWRRL